MMTQYREKRMRPDLVYIVVGRDSRNPVLSWLIHHLLNLSTGF